MWCQVKGNQQIHHYGGIIGERYVIYCCIFSLLRMSCILFSSLAGKLICSLSSNLVGLQIELWYNLSSRSQQNNGKKTLNFFILLLFFFNHIMFFLNLMMFVLMFGFGHQKGNKRTQWGRSNLTSTGRKIPVIMFGPGTGLMCSYYHILFVITLFIITSLNFSDKRLCCEKGSWKAERVGSQKFQG